MKKKYGQCHICGEWRNLTFEHTPPGCCFNDRPVKLQNINNLMKSSHYYGKSYNSNRGMGGYTLCFDCNQKLANRYVKSFKRFVHQAASQLITTQSIPKVSHFTLEPLNVIKQIIGMMMCVEHSGYLLRSDVQRYILEEQSTIWPTEVDFKIYLAYSESFGRQNGISFVGDLRDDRPKPYKIGEIIYAPFAYVITYDMVHPPDERFFEITHFRNYELHSTVDIRLPLKVVNSTEPTPRHYNKQ